VDAAAAAAAIWRSILFAMGYGYGYGLCLTHGLFLSENSEKLI
jgi:hypothetical protein